MQTLSRQDGFSLSELMMSTVITLAVLGTSMATFKNTLTLNETAQLLGDASQNLRAGTGLLVRDLMQAGRGMPTGGVPIPHGNGATPINRPVAPGTPATTFDNINYQTLPSVIPGSDLGPTVDNSTTDMITALMLDTTAWVQTGAGQPLGSLKFNCVIAAPPAGTCPAGYTNPVPTIAADGSSLNVGQFKTLVTDPLVGVKAGDLIMFTVNGQNALQTVTSTNNIDTIFFAQGGSDWFNFNQRANAAAGTIMNLRSGNPLAFTQGTIDRITMLSYYVDNQTTPGTPRLTRQYNHYAPQALAGVVEDLDISYDLSDGVTNPVKIRNFPYTDPTSGNVFSPNQIRAAELHAGVRSDTMSNHMHDYLRSHVTTVVSLRDMAYTDRYK